MFADTAEILSAMEETKFGESCHENIQLIDFNSLTLKPICI